MWIWSVWITTSALPLVAGALLSVSIGLPSFLTTCTGGPSLAVFDPLRRRDAGPASPLPAIRLGFAERVLSLAPKLAPAWRGWPALAVLPPSAWRSSPDGCAEVAFTLDLSIYLKSAIESVEPPTLLVSSFVPWPVLWWASPSGSPLRLPSLPPPGSPSSARTALLCKV